MKKNFYTLLLGALLSLTLSAQNPAQMYGVNLAGAEFGSNFPGTSGTDYFWPTNSDFDYFSGKGLKLIRLPFKWERIQPTMNAALNTAELNRLIAAIDYAQTKGMYVVVDMHNYGRRNINWTDYVIGSNTVPVANVKDCWTRLATALKNKSNIYGYGIMNEPHDMLQSAPWSTIAQEIINGIRSSDLTTNIIVGGDSWSSGLNWLTYSNNLKNLIDVSNKLIFEAHVYFDGDASGYYDQSYDGEGAYANVGVDRVTPFVNWLEANNLKGYVGEYGIPANDSRWNTVLSNFLTYIQAHCVNGTAWAAGGWWGNYALSLQPANSVDKPQMATLTNFLTIPTNNCSFICSGPQPNLGNDQTVCNQSVTLNSGVNAAQGITFQWYKDNILINGAGNSTYSASGAGTYKVTVTQNSCAKSDQININVSSGLTVQGDTVCNPGDMAHLNVLTAGGPYNWYAASTGGNSLYTGSTYDVTINNNTNFYVEGNGGVRQSIGPKTTINNPATSIDGWYINYNLASADSLRLDLDVNTTIDSIDVYCDYAASDQTLKFTVFNSSGAQVGQKIYTVVAGSQYMIRVPIGISLTAGNNYKLTLAGTTIKLWFDGQDAPYPYVVSGLGTVKWALAPWGADGYEVPSIYNIILNTTTNNSCGRTMVQATIDVCTDAIEVEKNKLTIYPNPSNQNFNLQLENIDNISQIILFDISGKELMRLPISSNNLSFGEELKEGVYILKIISGNKEEYKQIIKL